MSTALEFVIDDRLRVSPLIASIVGNRRYGAIVFRRKRLSEHFVDLAKAFDRNVTITHVKDDSELRDALARATLKNHAVYLHPAHIVPRDQDFPVSLKKLRLAGLSAIFTVNSKFAGAYNINASEILQLLENVHELDEDSASIVSVDKEFLVDISDYRTCLNFFSGGFEARHFNTVLGDSNYVHKKSSDKAKMKAEHDYYYLLSNRAKRWFVAPFDYSEEESTAGYSMERLLVPDAALQWIHSSFTNHSFSAFLQKLFLFLNERDVKVVTSDVIAATTKDSYHQKLKFRMELLKKHPKFNEVDRLVSAGTNYSGVDAVISKYLERFSNRKTARTGYAGHLTIGHGDLCLSNILYDKSTGLLKLIDPKGSSAEAGLWVDPYYDIAKLSHSILGDYDWINNDLFTISLNQSNKLSLYIETSVNTLDEFKEAFRNALTSNNVDLCAVRLYECSLFLSMLPLHIDRPLKVVAFILRAISILEELDLNDLV